MPPSGNNHTLRVPDETWSRWERQARACGLSTTAWIVMRVDREVTPKGVRAAVGELRRLVTVIDDAASDAGDAMDAIEDAVALPLPRESDG